MKSSQVDNELCMRHSGGRLTAAMTKHVDDLKGTGDSATVQHILSELQEVFCDLKIDWYTFTNCGVRHMQCQVTKEITLDQIQLANNLRIDAPSGLTQLCLASHTRAFIGHLDKILLLE